jgi:hypothetical protein
MNKFFLISIILFFSYTSYSQIVNIEQQRVTTDSNGFTMSLNASSLAIKDKTDKFELLSGVNFSIRHNKHLFLNYTTYNVGKIENTNYTNKFFIHNRYNYDLYKNIYTGEIFILEKYLYNL